MDGLRRNMTVFASGEIGHPTIPNRHVPGGGLLLQWRVLERPLRAMRLRLSIPGFGGMGDAS